MWGWVSTTACVCAVLTFTLSAKNKSGHRGDLSLWIDEQQVKMFSGLNPSEAQYHKAPLAPPQTNEDTPHLCNSAQANSGRTADRTIMNRQGNAMEIYAIVDGKVLPYILDPNFEKYLPVVPSEVSYVNFTWKSGAKQYYYNFDRLQSFNEDILEPPVISIKTKGKVPRKPKVFSVLLPCNSNSSGIAAFGIGLLIESRKGKPLPGTPLRLRLRKECAKKGPDPECDKKCANGGWCNKDKICQCQEGYVGPYCRAALCYPQCMNNGSCTAPGVCSCPDGYQGRHCEGGICAEKCQNGGKCVQKDSCDCPKGYYGLRCEFSKCSIACLNGGRCRDVNKCRCPRGFRGDHCEIGRHITPGSSCAKACGHGVCTADNTCACDPGWFGRYCYQRHPHKRKHDSIYTSESSSEVDLGDGRIRHRV